jgi:hypothetical protein
LQHPYFTIGSDEKTRCFSVSWHGYAKTAMLRWHKKNRLVSQAGRLSDKHPLFVLRAMGEEKPEEELMGKRKSSPRLSATPFRVLLILYFPFKKENIRGA